MKRPIPKTRSRAQRAFFAWLNEATPRFKIPLCIEKRTDKDVIFSFVGIPAAIRGYLTFDYMCWERSLNTRKKQFTVRKISGGEVIISVDWQDQSWDILLCLEVLPERTARGYVCHECEPEARELFPSREALWKDHLFEPLLKWINEELATARAVGIYQTRDEGGTWAKLLYSNVDSESDYRIAELGIDKDRSAAL